MDDGVRRKGTHENANLAYMFECLRYHAKMVSVSEPTPPSRFFIHGESGIGKTYLVRRLLVEKSTAVVKIDRTTTIQGSSLFQTNLGDGEALLSKKFHTFFPGVTGGNYREPKENHVHLIVFEGMESIFGHSFKNLEKHGKVFEAMVVRRFSGLLLSLLKRLPPRVCFVGTWSYPSSTRQSHNNILEDMGCTFLFGYKRLEHVIYIRPPDKMKRVGILKTLLGWHGVKCDSPNYALNVHASIEKLAQLTNGYTPADLELLCREGGLSVLGAIQFRKQTVASDGIRAFNFDQHIFPSLLSNIEEKSVTRTDRCIETSPRLGVVKQASCSCPCLSKLRGVSELKSNLEQHVLLPLKHPERFLRHGVRPPTGILLYGAEGNGKSYMTLSVGKELEYLHKASVHSVSCTSLLSKVIGESEEKISRLFADARRTAPSLIILDEIQAIAPKRGGDSSNENTFDRLLSCLLVEMDGIGHKKISENGGNKRQVFVVAVTRSISDVDEALLRPGRLDCALHISGPTKEDAVELSEFFLQTRQEMRGGGMLMVIKNGEKSCSVMSEFGGLSRADIMHIHKENCMRDIRAYLRLQNK